MKRIISLLFICFMSFENIYAERNDAGNYITNVANKVINIVESHSLSDHEKEEKLTVLFEEAIDIKWIARFVLGKQVQSISQEDFSQYELYYTKFLLKSYIPNFRKYTGQKFRLVNVTQQKTDQYKVDTEIIGQHNNPIDINYMLKKVDGSYKIYDIIAENISLIATQRSEFSSVLAHKGIDYLITQLKERSNLH